MQFLTTQRFVIGTLAVWATCIGALWISILISIN